MHIGGRTDHTVHVCRSLSRRIQRILPALVLVVAVTLALGGWLLWPQEYRQLGAHAAANAVFALNLGGRTNQYDIWPNAYDRIRPGDGLTVEAEV